MDVRFRAPILAATAAALLLVTVVGAGPAAASAMAPGHPLVVTFKSLPPTLAVGSSFQGGTITRLDHALGFAIVTPTAVGMSALDADPNVASIESDASHAWLQDAAPSDPLYAQQYAPQQVRAPDAWPEAAGGPGATLCFVDTGVRYTHEDLGGARYLGGYDFVHNTNDPIDDNGHGTHVVGIAAASIDNGKGIAGISQASYYMVKVLDSTGSGPISGVASGIAWCADHKATVISMSIGGASAQVLQNAVSYAWSKGSLIVAAAGNDGPCTNCVEYPAAYPEVLAVTCTTQTRSLCSFSSQGPQAALAAPGYQILSTYDTSDTAYKTLSGTSMSTPAVAGVAALVAGKVPMSNAQLKALLLANAQNGGAGRTDPFGYGIVDAKATLDAALAGAPAPGPGVAPIPGPMPVPAPAPAPAPGGRAPSAPVAVVAPIPQLTIPAGYGYAAVPLDGSASHDAGGTILRWTWSEAGQVIANGPHATAYLGPGVHTVTLQVADNLGARGMAVTKVTVAAAPAQAGAPTFWAQCSGLQCSFQAGASGWATWSFGDGGSGVGAETIHAFPTPGTYAVTLKLVTYQGLASTTETVTVRA